MMELLIILSFPLGFATGYFWPVGYNGRHKFNKVATDMILDRLTDVWEDTAPIVYQTEDADLRIFSSGVSHGLKKAIYIVKAARYDLEVDQGNNNE